jgi:chemotaxis protein methyltransferase CheR
MKYNTSFSNASDLPVSASLSDVNEREFVFTSSDFSDVAERIYHLAGIVLKEHKKDMVYSRLSRRLRQLNLNSFAEYRKYLDSSKGGDETQSLINALTTNLTSFFREPHHFEHLKNKVIKPMMAAGQPTKVRLWCSASSTGQEPYSIAMTLNECGLIAGKDDVKVLATDLDTSVLDKATKGIYPENEVTKCPMNIQRHFSSAGHEQMKVHKNLQDFLLFRQLNLMDNWPMKGPFDAIFCRNVLIYFDKPTCKVIIDKMLSLLKEGGTLYLGHSESMPVTETRVVPEGHTIYRKR